ncbi:four helix bundle protein [Flagellimonas myxillae]|uniref:four helix bundle protein n=1 Tax=Flagellimonas myxillae TaxID=2942214 RepID=UPI00201E9A02|nr:four helix bundle protein [Muricauda myxillae]MCL6266417.1 four helix bundle protein [Muricauda myxillae]
MRRRNVVEEKSFRFALEIIELAKRLEKERKEFVLSKQILRSGTSIGALVREAEHDESKKDFIHKMSISLKEANETRYWLDLLINSDSMENQDYNRLNDLVTQIIKLLAAIVKSSKLNS